MIKSLEELLKTHDISKIDISAIFEDPDERYGSFTLELLQACDAAMFSNIKWIEVSGETVSLDNVFIEPTPTLLEVTAFDGEVVKCLYVFIKTITDCEGVEVFKNPNYA